MGRISCKISDDEYMKHMDALMTQLNVFATGGSGWVVKTLCRLEINTVCCNNITASSYIETPALLKPLKCSLLNAVHRGDNFCFLYCIAAALFSFTGKLFRPNSHKKTSRIRVSTRSSCQGLYPQFPGSQNVIIVPLMSINWRIPSWCRCITAKTERAGKKLIDYASWKTKTIIIAWLKFFRTCFTFLPDLNLNKTRNQSQASVEIVSNALSKKLQKSCILLQN